MKGLFVAIGVAAVALGGAMYLRDGHDTTPSNAPNISVRATASGGFAPETVLQIRPQAASAAKPAEASRRSALAPLACDADSALASPPSGRTPSRARPGVCVSRSSFSPCVDLRIVRLDARRVNAPSCTAALCPAW